MTLTEQMEAQEAELRRVRRYRAEAVRELRRLRGCRREVNPSRRAEAQYPRMTAGMRRMQGEIAMSDRRISEITKKISATRAEILKEQTESNKARRARSRYNERYYAFCRRKDEEDEAGQLVRRFGNSAAGGGDVRNRADMGFGDRAVSGQGDDGAVPEDETPWGYHED